MPTALSPAVLELENAPNQQVSVGNSGEGTLNYTITDDQTWLSLSSSGGMVAPGSPDVVTVSYATSTLGQGVHQATITVSDPTASNDPQTVEVTLLVTELPAIALSETMLHRGRHRTRPHPAGVAETASLIRQGHHPAGRGHSRPRGSV